MHFALFVIALNIPLAQYYFPYKRSEIYIFQAHMHGKSAYHLLYAPIFKIFFFSWTWMSFFSPRSLCKVNKPHMSTFIFINLLIYAISFRREYGAWLWEAHNVARNTDWCSTSVAWCVTCVLSGYLPFLSFPSSLWMAFSSPQGLLPLFQYPSAAHTEKIEPPTW